MKFSKVALLGSPVKYSPSLKKHPHLFQELGLYVEYTAIETTAEEVKTRLKMLWNEGYHWLAITMPLKKKITEYLHSLTLPAKAARAVNVVYRTEKGWLGDNTDGIGALRAIEAHIPITAATKVLVIGAGGAGSAIVHELERRQAQISWWNRTTFSSPYAVSRIVGDFDLIVQATSVGMHPESQKSITNWEEISAKVALDVVSNPLQTQFLTYAQEKKVIPVNGVMMFAFLVMEQLKKAYPQISPEKIEFCVQKFYFPLQ